MMLFAYVVLFPLASTSVFPTAQAPPAPQGAIVPRLFGMNQGFVQVEAAPFAAASATAVVRTCMELMPTTFEKNVGSVRVIVTVTRRFAVSATAATSPAAIVMPKVLLATAAFTARSCADAGWASV